MQPFQDASNLSPARAGAAALLDALPGVMAFVRRHMRRRRARGLSVPQFRTLLLVRHFPAASVSAVSEHLSSSLPTASRIVTGLVNKGLLTRKTCREDRRQMSLQITARGNAVLDRAYGGTRDVIAEQFQSLSPAQLGGIREAMSLLRDVFQSNPACEAEPASLAQTA